MDREIHNLSFCNFNACVATILHCISYQSLLSESPQLPYLILKHEITCIKGSKNICFLIFYILSGTINQSIIWVASSSFMESSTYSPPDPNLNLFLSVLRKMCVNWSWKISQLDHIYINQEIGFCQDFVDCKWIFWIEMPIASPQIGHNPHPIQTILL